MEKIRPYAKTVVAVAGAVASVATVIAAGGDVSQVILAVLTALGVYQVKNA